MAYIGPRPCEWQDCGEIIEGPGKHYCPTHSRQAKANRDRRYDLKDAIVRAARRGWVEKVQAYRAELDELEAA